MSTCNTGDLGLIPGSGRSPGEGNSNPLQYSCLENPMDGGAWWATVQSNTNLLETYFQISQTNELKHSLTAHKINEIMLVSKFRVCSYYRLG